MVSDSDIYFIRALFYMDKIPIKEIVRMRRLARKTVQKYIRNAPEYAQYIQNPTQRIPIENRSPMPVVPIIESRLLQGGRVTHNPYEAFPSMKVRETNDKE